MGGSQVTSTASVLFTDVVGSTELRARLGEEAADEFRRAHDDAVAAAIEESKGRVVKSMGDGLMAVFDAAADAVGAAISSQQRIHALSSAMSEDVAIRVGVSVGDVSSDDGDFFGTAVNEAARLCAAAKGGQILVADLVRALARGRGGFVFQAVGALELKGIDELVETCSVGWEPIRSRAADGLVPFPPPLKPGVTGGYIGRTDVRDTLRSLWDDTKLEGPRTGLLVGEPGIGKTRTAYEIAEEARESGAIVLFGRCDDELNVPYQPFVEAFEWQTRHAPDLPLGRLPGELVRLVPSLAERRPGLDPPVASDPRTEEHRLFEAVATWIADTARETGLVLVLDDLHWATKPTLLMLMHAVRHAAGLDGVRLLVIGTYRDTDVDRSHPLSAVLGDLQRIDGVRRIAIDPLDADEVIALLEEAAGHPLDDVTRGVAARTHAETEGNPFFVGEVLRHLIESGSVRFVDGYWIVPDPDQIDIPEGVRDVVGQRLSRLSDLANDLLRAASVVGREFDLDLVGELTGTDDDALLDAVDEATRARLVEEVDADRYRFAHALVRTSLYDELSASRRRRMHRAVTDLIAKRTPDDLAALAHHSVEAGPRGGDLSDAIGYVLAAADQSREASALGEAENLYGKAIELLEEDDAEAFDPRMLLARCGIGEILRDTGEASFREALLAVAEDAVEAGNDGLLVRAVLANSRGFVSIVGDVDAERIALIEAALARVSDTAIADRSRLQSLLALELLFDPERRGECLALLDHSIQLLDDIDDPLTEAHVLGMTRIVEMVPQRWTECIDRSVLAVEAADRCGDPNVRVANRISHMWALQSVGDFEGVRRVSEEFLAIAADAAGPIQQWSARAQAAHIRLFVGDLSGAAAENDAAFEFGREIGAVDCASWWAAIGSVIGWLRDQSSVPADLAGQMADQYPGAPSWRLAQAASLSREDRIDECRRLIEEHGLGDPMSIPMDVFWFSCVNNMARAVRNLDDPALAQRWLSATEPYADSVNHFCVALNGPMRRCRADLRAAAGDLDGAITEARLALDFATDKALELWAVMYRIELAEMLARRRGDADVDAARVLLAEAIIDAERLGMVGWVPIGADLLEQL